MSRRAEHIFPLIERTVPMLFVIGAVLSVLLLFFPEILWLRIGACALWLGAVAGGMFMLIFRRKSKKNTVSDRLEAERDRFLSDVAHELKTPLTVIRGCAEVLGDGAVSEELFPEYCRRILEETEAMSRLVSDLLDVSRLRAGRIRFEPRDVSLEYLAQSVCESLGIPAEKKGVKVVFEARASLPVLSLDYDRIRQLLVILTDNAVKHTPAEGTVTVSLDRVGGRVLLRVSDTGHGIAPEDLPYVFERFYKADASRGGLPAGSGIGLSIARQIARLHDGEISVESRENAGTCFTVDLPLREYKNSEDGEDLPS